MREGMASFSDSPLIFTLIDIWYFSFWQVSFALLDTTLHGTYFQLVLSSAAIKRPYQPLNVLLVIDVVSFPCSGDLRQLNFQLDF